MVCESRCKKKVKISLSLTVQRILLSTLFVLHASYLPTFPLSFCLLHSQLGCPSGNSSLTCLKHKSCFPRKLTSKPVVNVSIYSMSIYAVVQTKALKDKDLLGSFLLISSSKSTFSIFATSNSSLQLFCCALNACISPTSKFR